MISFDYVKADFNPQPVTLSLYIHIPFCKIKCGYCDFYSIPLKKDVLQLYLRQIHQELIEVSQFYNNVPLSSIFIGGGSPSVISATDIKKYLNIKELCNLTDDCEVSIEVNPEHVSDELLKAYRTVGINRISMGIQSFSNENLQSLDRSVSVEAAIKAAETVASQWNGRYSFDMIYGAQGQTVKSVLADIDRAMSFNPEHISFYNLTVEEDTPLAGRVKNGSVQLPSDSVHTEMHIQGKALLESHGLYQYEVSNYSKNGAECRHNIRYWDMKPYIGIGTAAASTVPNINNKAVRREGIKNVSAYCQNTDTYSCEILSADSLALEHILMSFRMNRGLNKELFFSRFKTDLQELASNTILHWIDKGLLINDMNNYRLDGRGLLFVNSFVSELYDELAGIQNYDYS